MHCHDQEVCPPAGMSAEIRVRDEHFAEERFEPLVGSWLLYVGVSLKVGIRDQTRKLPGRLHHLYLNVDFSNERHGMVSFVIHF